MTNNLPAEAEHAPASAPVTFGNRLSAGTGHNAGAVAIESERAIAEAQGQLVLAKRFPRSMAAAQADFMDACKSEEFAKTAFYTVPNRGTGPSIRFAEEVARCYGNFEYGHRELSRSDGKSEIEVYAWDKERNNRSTRQITVMHILDTKNGPRKLNDQADIDNRIANIASKQIRGRILALVPKHMVAAGVSECKKTLAGGNDKPISQRIDAMTAAFSRLGATTAHLETYLGHKLDTTTTDELADLLGIHNAIKEGAPASDYFNAEPTKDDKAAAITAAAKTGAEAAKGETKTAPKAEAKKDAPKAESKQTAKAAHAKAAPPPTDEPPLADEPPDGPGEASDEEALF